jgi:cytochrome c oxidase subunit 4
MAKHHEISVRTYAIIFAVLLALTALTVAIAYADLGPLSAPIAVAIAGVKATLVILYFMHVRYESPLIALCAAAGFLMLVIMVAITMGEVVARPAQPTDGLSTHR